MESTQIAVIATLLDLFLALTDAYIEKRCAWIKIKN
tara:strand:+ start:186 stop:293 length:108 start_codon:yes stop_codon:yes gene_type:complete